MAVNKVIYNGSTLIDLTGDTVTQDNLLRGTLAHAASGEQLTGTLDVYETRLYKVAIPTTGWTAGSGGVYTQTIAVNGITTSDICGDVNLVQSGVEEEARQIRDMYLDIIEIRAASGGITVKTLKPPTIAFDIMLKVIDFGTQTPTITNSGAYFLSQPGGMQRYTKRPTIYGFHIDSSESDPSDAVTYLGDAVGMTPAHMDFTHDKFIWGSWKDAFFMPKPCMLKSDGTVDYYLNPDDYTKKLPSGSSAVGNFDYNGNAMMEWGQNGKKIWYKIVPDANDSTSATVYIADEQIDADYVAWSFLNNQGNWVDHFYTPIYNGTIDTNDKLRSISGKDCTVYCHDKTGLEELTLAKANNSGNDVIWLTEVFCDIILINLLLILMGKSLNTQAVFGKGYVNTSYDDIDHVLNTGTMNNKGLFWGSQNDSDGVKVFGMENWWSNINRRYLGLMVIDGYYKYKLSYNREDGSSHIGYTILGSGYLTGPTIPQADGVISAMTFTGSAFFPTDNGGTSSTYYCDNVYVPSETVQGNAYMAERGGSYRGLETVGAFRNVTTDTSNRARWRTAACLSAKPLY